MAPAVRGAVWAALDAPVSPQFPWDPASTYLRRPPFVALPSRQSGPTELVARPLIVLGDDITTDHISPAGAIPANGEAGRWLIERGENPRDLNVFSSRRGNFEAMVRGIFTNRSVRNLLAPEAAPGWTRHGPSGELLPLHRAAERRHPDGDPRRPAMGILPLELPEGRHPASRALAPEDSVAFVIDYAQLAPRMSYRIREISSRHLTLATNGSWCLRR